MRECHAGQSSRSRLWRQRIWITCIGNKWIPVTEQGWYTFKAFHGGRRVIPQQWNYPVDQASLVEQQKHDLLAQYAMMLLKPQVHVQPCPKPENLYNAWIKNMCDVFCEPFKWVTNHDTPFPGPQTGGNRGPRSGNSGNSGNRGGCGGNERYGGKNNKNDNTGQAGGGGGGNH